MIIHPEVKTDAPRSGSVFIDVWPPLTSRDAIADPLVANMSMYPHVPSHFPQFPPKHTYEQTETHLERIENTSILRSKRANESYWVSEALIDLEEKTGKILARQLKISSEVDKENKLEKETILALVEGKHLNEDANANVTDQDDDDILTATRSNWEYRMWEKHRHERQLKLEYEQEKQRQHQLVPWHNS